MTVDVDRLKTAPRLKCSWHYPQSNPVLADDDVHVWCAALDQRPALVRQCEQALSDDERVKAKNFCFEDDRNRFIVGRGVLRAIIASYLHIEPHQVRFSYTSYGKPYLEKAPGPRSLQFSSSRSYGLALYALTYDRAVGVDIEHVRPIPELVQIAARVFSARERHSLQMLSKQQRLVGFFNGWTRKEAYAKATGCGIFFPLNKIEVSFVPGQSARFIQVGGHPEEAARWSLVTLEHIPGYAAALVVEGDDWHLSLWQFSTDAGKSVPT